MQSRAGTPEDRSERSMRISGLPPARAPRSPGSPVDTAAPPLRRRWPPRWSRPRPSTAGSQQATGDARSRHRPRPPLPPPSASGCRPRRRPAPLRAASRSLVDVVVLFRGALDLRREVGEGAHLHKHFTPIHHRSRRIQPSCVTPVSSEATEDGRWPRSSTTEGGAAPAGRRRRRRRVRAPSRVRLPGPSGSSPGWHGSAGRSCGGACTA